MTKKSNSDTPKIAQLRTKVGLSQRGLAEAVGVTENTIAKWEQGKEGSDQIEKVADLCDALSCTLEELIAEDLYQLRQAAHCTQRSLAKAVGVTETTIANWEKGHNSLFEKVARLCLALDCDIEELLPDKKPVKAMPTLNAPSQLRGKYLAEQLRVARDRRQGKRHHPLLETS